MSAGPTISPEETEASGLSPEEAARRLQVQGPNELPPPPSEGVGRRLLRQLGEPMALLLIVAAGVAGIGLREYVDAVAILVIVVLNATIGVAQEGKAARALEALRQMETPMARVRRGGTTLTIPSPEVVQGDVVLLAAGDRVPADLRLTRTSALEVDESLLTGESLPVAKRAGAVAGPGAGLGEQLGAAFSGSLVTRGSAEGVAVATGARSQLGRIAEQLAARPRPTPLQRELASLTLRLGTVAVVVAVGFFALILVRAGVSGEALEQAFLSAVALAVAAVPEGLATVVTVGLALGVRRMASAGAIVRRMPAVETLGSTTAILTDKTGTLTENRMRVAEAAWAGGGPTSWASMPERVLERAAAVAALCNDAELDPTVGDPLEVALLETVGPDRVGRFREDHPRVVEIPFDSERKRMTTGHRAPGGGLLAVKGAPEAVLALSTRTAGPDGRDRELVAGGREALRGRADEMAGRGMRVLALADRALPEEPSDGGAAEEGLSFVALVGLRDPVREEAPDAVAEARSAGIRLVMVTGDHAGTAATVAERVGLLDDGDRVLDGTALRQGGVPEDPLSVSVYARVDPQEKLALVRALRDRGQVVAVTGDGVNDAPALREADIGVAMGRTGSDVAREASDMVVTDDNLATIVTAVREGRGIYDNIRKVVDYLVGGNLSEILVVVSALLLFPGLGVPLLPLQLLWINLLTDGLPALALGVDPFDPRLMGRSPRPRSQRVLSGPRLTMLLGRGALIASGAVGGLVVARFALGSSWPEARTVMFTGLVVAHLLYAFVVRGRGARAFGNPWLLGAVAAGIALQAAVVLLPGLRDVFRVAPLEPGQWLLAGLAGVVPIAVLWFLPRVGRSG
jgi:P-type Ca2+ transporter type 2C